jgi:hypothetical protein
LSKYRCAGVESLEEHQQFSLAKMRRNRWNVLDLITIVARGSTPGYLFTDVDVTASECLRARLASHGNKITITAILLKAISIAQKAYPDSRRFQLAWGNQITEKDPVAGFTVERDVAGQPVVFFAVIADAHRKTLIEIGEELEVYGNKPIAEVPQFAKELSLTRLPWVFRQIGIWVGMRVASLRRSVNPATFGLTSLGKFGIDALLGPTVTTCIFGVGSVEQRAVAINNNVEIREVMTLSLSVNTRVMSMMRAGAMMNAVKSLIESGLAGHLDPSESAAEILPLQQGATSFASVSNRSE